MNTCKTCKHWGRPRPGWNDNHHGDDVCIPTDPDTYAPMVMPYEVKQCGMPTQTFCEFPVERNGFGLADGSTYFAGLYTAEEFGCVRHEGIAE